MTNEDFRRLITGRIKSYRYRSAWARGVFKYAIEQLGWPLDRIVHAEVWATDTIPADLPPMVEFKDKADKIIKERWGIEVEHIRGCLTYDQAFYRVLCGRKRPGTIYGWPIPKGPWCNSDVKMPPLDKLERGDNIIYIGIAFDEPNRFHNLSDNKKSPLVEGGWTEADCRQWCEENDLLSPIYTTALEEKLPGVVGADA